MSEVELLRELIVHMWVHDGYRMNGYDKMTQAQRALYDSVVPPPSTRVDDEPPVYVDVGEAVEVSRAEPTVRQDADGTIHVERQQDEKA